MYDIRNMNIWKNEPATKGSSHDYLDMEVSELNLSVRSYNCLKRAGCHTVGDILALIADEEGGLRKIRNLGNRSETEILDSIRRYQEEYTRETDPPGNEPVRKDPEKKMILIKPEKKWWDTEIETFHLSDYALTRLKQKGVHKVKDLYATNPKEEPGWYAVRELFRKIPAAQLEE